MPDPASKPPSEWVFQVGGLARLPDLLQARSSRRALILCGPSRRFLDRVDLPGDVRIFDRAAVHVPRERVDAAAAAIREHEADLIVALGGGAAVGLGKALRLDHDLPFIAVPTTYAASEMTNIFGVTDGPDKHTGRDDRVRPDVILHDPELAAGLDRTATAQSLLNAMAHPVSALAAGAEGELRALALRAARRLAGALRQLVVKPRHRSARRDALRGAAWAGQALDRGTMADHHRVAHALGGRFGVDHATLHAALLPQFVHSLRSEASGVHAALCEALGTPQPGQELFDLLGLVGAPTSLMDMNMEHDPILEALDDRGLGHTWVWVADAYLGRRPATTTRRREASQGGPATAEGGVSLAGAERVVIAVHGRGATSDSILKRAREILGDAPGTAIVAPQAAENRWYGASYRSAPVDDAEAVRAALDRLDAEVARACAEVPADRVHLLGFSQGACVVLEYLARTDRQLGSVVALAGARLGPPDKLTALARRREGMPVLLGVSRADPWVPVPDVEATAENLRAAGADVELVVDPGDRHEMSLRQRIRARRILRGQDGRGLPGFGNIHVTEDLPGALPGGQNTPRQGPYGLYPEQINGTGFTARRHENLRTWMYRVRPSAGQRRFSPLQHATLVDDYREARAEVNLSAVAALPDPGAGVDFVDGLHTYGGAGGPDLRRGFAIHVYAATANMEHRCLYDADGDLLVVPQEGGLTVVTELGVLEAGPGQIVLVPRGIKFSVLLEDALCRGYVAEVFGPHFRLPDRGPIGSNGLADERDFLAPAAWHEDRPDPGYRVTVKQGGRLHETTVDHTPWDVVGWHGNYAPYVYDLSCFIPLSTVRVDHADPSVYSVIGAPMDEPGASTLDLVVFPPRWDATEHTFRPPFFHRNAVTEFNGIVRDGGAGEGPFQPGMCFLTPPMTAHGVLESTVERVLGQTDEVADRPHRHASDTLWFQFECALPVSLSRWAREGEQTLRDWDQVWGSYRARFDPEWEPGADG